MYPRGPSSQFYKLFLDPEVSKEFELYDALAIIESDVAVAHEKSFERLYKVGLIVRTYSCLNCKTFDRASSRERARERSIVANRAISDGNIAPSYGNFAPSGRFLVPSTAAFNEKGGAGGAFFFLVHALFT